MHATSAHEGKAWASTNAQARDLQGKRTVCTEQKSEVRSEDLWVGRPTGCSYGDIYYTRPSPSVTGSLSALPRGSLPMGLPYIRVLPLRSSPSP